MELSWSLTKKISVSNKCVKMKKKKGQTMSFISEVKVLCFVYMEASNATNYSLDAFIVCFYE